MICLAFLAAGMLCGTRQTALLAADMLLLLLRLGQLTS
jgi:hypothetical protein